MSDEDVESDRAELGDEIGEDVSLISTVLGHGYRGELDRETTWRSRLDQTTTWTVTVMAAILTWAFSSPDNPHYIILVAVVVTTVFLLIEARRYRDYDVYRSRVRLYQQNLLADTLDPSTGVELADWRLELSEDYRRPTMKISFREALVNRLRRIYFALLAVLFVAWIFRVTAFAPAQATLDAASVGSVSGTAVLATVAVFYLVVAVLTVWPQEREAKEEFHEGERGEWKQPDHE